MYLSDVDEEGDTDDPLFEITVRSYCEPHSPGKTVFWGIPATNEKVGSRVKVENSLNGTKRSLLTS